MQSKSPFGYPAKYYFWSFRLASHREKWKDRASSPLQNQAPEVDNSIQPV